MSSGNRSLNKGLGKGFVLNRNKSINTYIKPDCNQRKTIASRQRCCNRETCGLCLALAPRPGEMLPGGRGLRGESPAPPCPRAAPGSAGTFPRGRRDRVPFRGEGNPRCEPDMLAAIGGRLCRFSGAGGRCPGEPHPSASLRGAARAAAAPPPGVSSRPRQPPRGQPPRPAPLPAGAPRGICKLGAEPLPGPSAGLRLGTNTLSTMGMFAAT